VLFTEALVAILVQGCQWCGAALRPAQVIEPGKQLALCDKCASQVLAKQSGSMGEYSDNARDDSDG